MASTTITGRIFLAIGTYLATSIFSKQSNTNNIAVVDPNIINLKTTTNVEIEGQTSIHSFKRTSEKIIKNTNITIDDDDILSPLNYTKAAIADKIINLPGLSYNISFNQFSGYLDASSTRHIFYWYVESQSDPVNDPVVLWTNGGPGCSGLLGFGTEHGPFHIDGTGTLTPNQYSWNRIANMLYIEQPAGVGFSYYDTESDKTTGDAQAATDNYEFILSFLKRYPERRTNPFYIASESYGGHYMPQLAMVILHNDFYHKLINFKGMMIGNPYVDPYTNAITSIRAYYNHGLIAKPLFDKWVKKCENPRTYNSDECIQIESDMAYEFGPGINPYALDYPVCFENAFLENEVYEFDLHDKNNKVRTTAIAATIGKSSKRQHHNNKKKKHHGKDNTGLLGNNYFNNRRQLIKRSHHHHNHKYYDDDDFIVDDDTTFEDDATTDDDNELRTYSSQVNAFNQFNQDNVLAPAFLPAQDSGYRPCSQVHLERYLNRHDVREALHVVDQGGYLWSGCSDDIIYSDIDFDASVINDYKDLIKMAIARRPDGKWINNLNMLIFSGDDDSIASTVGTQDWIWDLGLPPKSHNEWRAWKVVNNQTAGFVVHFKLQGDSSFIFATVHGAGHEVPAYRPYEALELFAKYLDRSL